MCRTYMQRKACLERTVHDIVTPAYKDFLPAMSSRRAVWAPPPAQKENVPTLPSPGDKDVGCALEEAKRAALHGAQLPGSLARPHLCGSFQ